MLDIFSQFIIKPLNSFFFIQITNLSRSLFIFSMFFCILIIMCLFSPFNKIIILLYDFIKSIAQSNIKNNSNKFIPFLMFVFLFILTGNISGLIPGFFSFNSHFFSTIIWSLFVFIYGIYQGLQKPKTFFSNFYISTINKSIAFFLLPIKIFSFLIRPLSLAMRLTISNVAGHIIVHVCEYFITPSLVGIGGLIGLILLLFVELCVGIMQAYIFTIMSAAFINDCVNH